MKILLLRVSCQKEKHLWTKFRKHKFDQVILCGDPNLNSKYKLEGDVLYLKCRDTYDALPEKMIAALNAVMMIQEFSDVNRFVKLDSDNSVRSSFKIRNNIVVLNNHYVGQRIWWMKNHENPRGYHFGRVPKDSYWYNRKYKGEMYPYADGGCSYILSRKAVKCITNEYGLDDLDEVYHNHIYEDMMIGLILKKYGITPRKANYFISGDKKVT